MIADAVAQNPKEEYNSGATAGEWTSRRIRKLRLRNRRVSAALAYSFDTSLTSWLCSLQGPETWYEAKGTEHQVVTGTVAAAA